MKSKKSQKKKIAQDKISEKIEKEKVKLDHPRGKERFTQVLKNVINK